MNINLNQYHFLNFQLFTIVVIVFFIGFQELLHRYTLVMISVIV